MRATREAVFEAAVVEAWLRIVPRKMALKFLKSLDEVMTERETCASATPLRMPEYPEAVKGARVLEQAVQRAFVRRG